MSLVKSPPFCLFYLLLFHRAAETEAGGHQAASDDLTVSVDGAWQKCGSGRSYNSLSGEFSHRIV